MYSPKSSPRNCPQFAILKSMHHEPKDVWLVFPPDRKGRCVIKIVDRAQFIRQVDVKEFKQGTSQGEEFQKLTIVVYPETKSFYLKRGEWCKRSNLSKLRKNYPAFQLTQPTTLKGREKHEAYQEIQTLTLAELNIICATNARIAEEDYM